MSRIAGRVLYVAYIQFAMQTGDVSSQRYTGTSNTCILPVCPNPTERICDIRFGHTPLRRERVTKLKHPSLTGTFGDFKTLAPQMMACTTCMGTGLLGYVTLVARPTSYACAKFLVRRAIIEGEGDKQRQWTVTKPSSMPPGWAFVEEVVTCLPYYEAFSNEEFTDMAITFSASVNEFHIVLCQKVNTPDAAFESSVRLIAFCSF